MNLLSLRGVAERLGISYDTVRKYATKKTLYPDFPEKKTCPHCQGVGTGYDAHDIDSWKMDRPGGGGGQHRRDPSEAGKKSWTTRRANQAD